MQRETCMFTFQKTKTTKLFYWFHFLRHKLLPSRAIQRFAEKGQSPIIHFSFIDGHIAILKQFHTVNYHAFSKLHLLHLILQIRFIHGYIYLQKKCCVRRLLIENGGPVHKCSSACDVVILK